MKYTNDLITQSRIIARNVANQDGTYSITDAEILQYLNDGQDRMQHLLNSKKNIAKPFVTEVIMTLVSGQEAYTIPDRVLLNKQVEYVEFSASGNVSDYIRLQKVEYFNRDTNQTSYPAGYFKRGNQILLQATPSISSGSLRISYERELDDLAKRLGIVVTASATQIVIMNVDTSLVPTGGDYVCITQPLTGERLATNIPVSSYAPGIIDATTVSAYLATGKTLADLVGGYCTVGAYTTATSQLMDAGERYLIHFAAAEMFRKDSSNDYQTAATVVATIEEDILKAYESQTGEVQYVPQIARYEWW